MTTMPTPESLAEVKEQVNKKLEEFQLKKQLRLLENLQAFGDGWGSFVDPIERFRELRQTEEVPIISTTQDRRFGRDWPFFQNETELALTRMPARLLLATNSYAIGLMNGLTSFTLNTGFTYRVVPRKYKPRTSTGKAQPTEQQVAEWVAVAQDVLEEYHDVNSWNSFEPELFWRSREDGEYYLRHFLTAEGVTRVRTVEPEQNRMPRGADLAEWSFGKRNPIDPGTGDIDAETTLEFNFVQLANPEIEEQVPADEVEHCKINTKRSIKRGLTDFYGGTLATLDVAERLRRAVSEGAVEQASIIEIVKIVGHSKDTIGGFVDQANSKRETEAWRRNRVAKRRVIPEGQEYTPPPSATNVEPHLEALQACLRAACVRWNCPEFLGSANAENNALASAETAANHFVVTVERGRRIYKASFRNSGWIALRNAVKAERLPPEALDYIDLVVDAPPVVPDAKGEKAQADSIYMQNKVKSPQTTADELGLDSEQEMRNWEEFEERFGAAGPPLPMPGGGGQREGGEPAASPFPEGKNASGRWVTMNDTPVHISKDGQIDAGPEKLTGPYSQAKSNKAADKKKAAANSDKPSKPAGPSHDEVKQTIRKIASDHIKQNSVGPAFDTLYAKAKEQRPGLSKEDFRVTMSEFHREGDQFKLTGWPRMHADLPDPELAVHVGGEKTRGPRDQVDRTKAPDLDTVGKLMYYLQPASGTVRQESVNPVPDIRQESDYDCGTACLRAVAQQCGLNLPSQWTLAGLLGTDPKDGTRPTELIQGADKLGLEWRGVPQNTAGLVQFVQAGFPVICAIQADEPGGTTSGHYVVVTGYDPETDMLAINDPVKGPTQMAAFSFGERWHDVDADGKSWDRWGLAVRKA